LPEETILYDVVRTHLESYIALREADPDDEPVPVHVERIFREYLKCGLPQWGTAVTDYVPSSGFTVRGDGDSATSPASGPAVRGVEGSG